MKTDLGYHLTVRDWLVGIALVVALSMTMGCAGMLGNVSRPDNLTPEQIRAYNEAGMDLYGCFQVGGPPPAGSTTWITMPKGKDVSIKFLPNCMVQMP